jgi:hypothetical protein
MKKRSSIFWVLLISASASGVFAEEPLACNVSALSASQRQRHAVLAERLAQAVVRREELSNGYALRLDLSRLPKDAAGEPFCVVEVAEWVDLESRCCPFLEFGIDVSGKGGPVTLRLTGGRNVKAFLEKELAQVDGSR